MITYILSASWWLMKGYIGGKIWEICVVMLDGAVYRYVFMPKNRLRLKERGAEKEGVQKRLDLLNQILASVY